MKRLNLVIATLIAAIPTAASAKSYFTQMTYEKNGQVVVTFPTREANVWCKKSGDQILVFVSGLQSPMLFSNATQDSEHGMSYKQLQDLLLKSKNDQIDIDIWEDVFVATGGLTLKIILRN